MGYREPRGAKENENDNLYEQRTKPNPNSYRPGTMLWGQTLARAPRQAVLTAWPVTQRALSDEADSHTNDAYAGGHRRSHR
jgi:hypothetical protein